MNSSQIASTAVPIEEATTSVHIQEINAVEAPEEINELERSHELPNATKATMNGLLQLILNRRIGTYTLPLNTTIIAAGNRAEDRAAVNEMPTPVKNRFAHYTIEANVDVLQRSHGLMLP